MMSRAQSRRLSIARTALLISTCAAAEPVIAQQPEEHTTEMIIVTATKREELLQDVPLSITVFSEEDIEKRQIDDFTDYMRLTPNFNAVGLGNPGRQNIQSIRGIANIGGRAGVIGIYVDEVVANGRDSIGSFDPALVDVQRIEVLRGPQGTYFGSNTMGGAISITTVKPSTKEFSGRMGGEFSAYQGGGTAWKLSGMVNVPIDNVVGLRVSGYKMDNTGWFTNTGPAQTGNGRERWAIRAALRINPGPDSTIDITYSTSRYQQDHDDLVDSGVPIAAFAPFYANLNRIPNPTLPRLPINNRLGFFPENRNRIATDFPSFSTTESQLVSGVFEQRFDLVTLKILGGLSTADYLEVTDADFTPIPAYTNEFNNNLRNYTGEARLVSNEPLKIGNTELDYVFGVFASSYNFDFFNPRFREAGNPWFRNTTRIQETLLTGGATDKLKSLAVFGDLTWRLAPKWTLRLGGRANRDRFRAVGPGIDSGILEFKNFTPQGSITFEPSDTVSIYAKVAEGYKPGGFNVSAQPQARFYRPEKLWSYDAGVKLNAFDRRLQASFSAYYYDWKDIQISQFNLPLGIAFVSNATKATIKGFEAEVSAQPVDGLFLEGTIGHTSTKLGSFPNALRFFTQTVIDATGNPLPLIPSWTGNAAAEYRFDIATDSKAFVRGEFIYNGGYQGALAVDNPPELRVPSFSTMNLRLGFETGRFAAAAYVENLFDKTYYTGAIFKTFSLTSVAYAVGAPRVFGLRGTVKF